MFSFRRKKKERQKSKDDGDGDEGEDESEEEDAAIEEGKEGLNEELKGAMDFGDSAGAGDMAAEDGAVAITRDSKESLAIVRSLRRCSGCASSALRAS